MNAFAHAYRSELGSSAPSRGHERRVRTEVKTRVLGLFLRILGGTAFPLILTAVLITISPRLAKSETPAPYPLEICIVSGDKLGADAIVFSYQGREIKTCCTNCIDEFYKDPAGYVAKIEEEARKAEK